MIVERQWYTDVSLSEKEFSMSRTMSIYPLVFSTLGLLACGPPPAAPPNNGRVDMATPADLAPVARDFAPEVEYSRSDDCRPVSRGETIATRIKAGQPRVTVKRVSIYIPPTDKAMSPLPCQDAYFTQATDKYLDGAALSAVKQVRLYDGQGGQLGAVFPGGSPLNKGDTLTFNVSPGVRLKAGETYIVSTTMDGTSTVGGTSLTTQTWDLTLTGTERGISLSVMKGPVETVTFTN